MTFFKNFKAQNNLQAILYLMGAEIFGFRQKLGPWRPFKDGNPHLVTLFATTCFQTPITFWGFSGLKLIVWLLAIWWAHNFLNFVPICACGSRSKRVTIKVFRPILPCPFQTPITWAWSGLFGHFLCSKWLSCHWLSDWHRNILMLAFFKPVAAV